MAEEIMNNESTEVTIDLADVDTLEVTWNGDNESREPERKIGAGTVVAGIGLAAAAGYGIYKGFQAAKKGVKSVKNWLAERKKSADAGDDVVADVEIEEEEEVEIEKPRTKNRSSKKKVESEEKTE